MPEVIFNGPEGRLEGRYHPSDDPQAPCALILPPHPKAGGHMDHRITVAMYEQYKARGFSVLRFNSGYSFGAWIGMQLLMRRPEVAGFISMSLPTNTYDFAFLAPCPASGLITYGTNDPIVPADDVDRIVEKIRVQKGHKIYTYPIEGADHFYTNHLDEAMHVIDDYLDANLDPQYCPPREQRFLEE